MAGTAEAGSGDTGSPGSHEGPWDLARCSHQHETVDTGIDTELLVGPSVALTAVRDLEGLFNQYPNKRGLLPSSVVTKHTSLLACFRLV